LTETIAVKAEHLYKAFGRRPNEIVKQLAAGKSRAEISHLGVAAVIDASFEVKKGEIFVVMGLSGSGKSTLIRMLNGLWDATSGSVTVGETNIAGISDTELRDVRRKSVSMVFQHFALLPHRTVIDNVAYGLEIQGMGREARLAKARTIIHLVGLDGWADRLPSELSGGMQQRVGLGRALAADTDVLLMDEAFSALDPLIRREMQEQLIELQAELGKTIIFITHDLNEAMFLGDRIAVMRDGRIVQIGTPEEILTDPANDYVAQFVQDVDRARVLTAASVMEPVRAVVTTSGGPRAALRVMREFQTSVAFVLNRDNSFVGVVRDSDVLKLVKAGETDLRTIILGHAVSVSEDTPLVDLVEPSVESAMAIAVVDEKKRLLGVIPRVTLLAALGNVSTNTGSLPTIEPRSTIPLSVLDETLDELATEGSAQ